MTAHTHTFRAQTLPLRVLCKKNCVISAMIVFKIVLLILLMKYGNHSNHTYAQQPCTYTCDSANRTWLFEIRIPWHDDTWDSWTFFASFSNFSRWTYAIIVTRFNWIYTSIKINSNQLGQINQWNCIWNSNNRKKWIIISGTIGEGEKIEKNYYFHSYFDFDFDISHVDNSQCVH